MRITEGSVRLKPKDVEWEERRHLSDIRKSFSIGVGDVLMKLREVSRSVISPVSLKK